MEKGTLPDGWEETVREVATIVACRRFPKAQLARDLCDCAPSHVWERRNSYDPARSFRTWCSKVVDNLAIDMLRNFRRRRRFDGVTGEDAIAERYGIGRDLQKTDGWTDAANWSKRHEDEGRNDPVCEDPHNETDRCLDGPQMFSPDDLKRLEDNLNDAPLRRVIALSVLGWWTAVPPDIWERWLTKARINPPFPPPFPDDRDDPDTRFRVIADASGVSPNAVRRHLTRARSVLKGLDYAREQFEGL